MRGELVAIDLETTGLDIQQDAVIEVGAVKFKDGEIVAEYETMVDPQRPIPSQTTHITGITQDDVDGAPRIEDVLPAIAEFIGDAPVIAHNIALDIGMLRDKHRILLGNKEIDTYDLALILMPRALRYNLNSLTQEVGINLENAHRALGDARATALFYWALWERVRALPHHVLKEIVRASGTIKWDTALVFEDALRLSTTSSEISDPPLYNFHAADTIPTPLTLAESKEQLDTEEIVAMFGPGGPIAAHFEQFEHRTQQQDVAAAVTHAFNQSQHLMIEAGTGTGKSLAYLLPAVLWATRNNQRIVVSTNTINLQDQLMSRDIPLLKSILGIDFNVAVMKGRSNYLSPQRLDNLSRRGPANAEELRTYAKILVWLQDNTDGDRSDINLHGPTENRIWNQISAQDADLTTAESANEPFQQARLAAEGAHLVIVNHALLIADARTDNHALPEFNYLVVDEAHHLEDAITRSLTTRIDQASLIYRLLSLGGPDSGLLGDILSTIRPHAPAKDVAKLEKFVGIIAEATKLMSVHTRALFKRAAKFIDEQRGQRPQEYTTQIRITNQQRERGDFSDIQNVWRTLNEFFGVLGDSMHRVTKALQKLQSHHISGLPMLAANTDAIAAYLSDTRQRLESFFITPEDNIVYWMRIGAAEDTPTLFSAPLHIGPMMERYLWSRKESVILTSASLRTNEGFDFMKDRLYADNAKLIEVDSPFDYRESTLVYVPTDVPEPIDRQGYQQALERAIVDTAAALDGRLMALFTSYNQLRQTAQAVTPRLALGNIAVYDQSDGTSRQTLLDGFKTTDKAVLLGTKSFWEGVDIPGESLSALIITRLPFGVPSDPIIAARADTYEDSFHNLTLPDAILRFRQGFGRLIRTKKDRGIVIILDARIFTKEYGMHFLESLPDCEVRKGSLEWLPQVAQEWLNR